MTKSKRNRFYFLKIRKQWLINPCERIHSTKKGKRGYDRQKFKRDWKKDEDFSF